MPLYSCPPATGRPDPLEARDRLHADIVIVGSGMGGGTLFHGLRDSGRSVLLIERGAFLPREPENADAHAVFVRGRYRTEPPWFDTRTGRYFQPGVYSWVGGSTKMFAASAPRFRVEDFERTTHADGESPAWPFRYADLESYYGMAERLYEVRGQIGEDPTEPPHSTPYPFPALEHEPVVERFAEALRTAGLHPFHMASTMALDTLEQRRAETTAAGGPSPTGVKGDTEVRAILPALDDETHRLLTEADVTRLITSTDGRTIVAAEASHAGRHLTIEGDQFVVSCGAVYSARLLLSSATRQHPTGLVNSSDLVGRNYMAHNATVMMGVHPYRINNTRWQKTLGMNDWYLSGEDPTHAALGNLQMMGKMQAPMLKAARPRVPSRVLSAIARRSLDIHVSSEDLPRMENRVTIHRRTVHLTWNPSNLAPHVEMVKRMRRLLREAGYPFVLTQRMGISYNSHQCGTVVAGTDPDRSVLDANCRSHDVENLWVVDGSFFPSAAALNPGMTIAANALRVAPCIAAAQTGHATVAENATSRAPADASA